MLLIVVAVSLALLLVYLGYIQAHWIAPAVLFFVLGPPLIAYLLSESLVTLFAALIGLLVCLYASFTVGRLLDS